MPKSFYIHDFALFNVNIKFDSVFVFPINIRETTMNMCRIILVLLI